MSVGTGISRLCDTYVPLVSEVDAFENTLGIWNTFVCEFYVLWLQPFHIMFERLHTYLRLHCNAWHRITTSNVAIAMPLVLIHQYHE